MDVSMTIPVVYEFFEILQKKYEFFEKLRVSGEVWYNLLVKQ
jgi:hypothetical protein